MFSVIFPGQGSQVVGMASELYSKYDLIKKYFKEADDVLKLSISKIILEGPDTELNLTENTQPAVFLVSYSIYKLMTENFGIKLENAKYFAGHSLGEYSAITCAGGISFHDCLRVLQVRGKAMQSALNNSKGSMLAILGSEINFIENILDENKNDFKCYIANDNSNQQIVVSGLNQDIEKFIEVLKNLKIKNIKLPVSAPFHCMLMSPAKVHIKNILEKVHIKELNNPIISNVTANVINDIAELPNLLINQVEKRVRWRESINFMVDNNINDFIEIGPGKVLSNLIKRINKNVNVTSINSDKDMKEMISRI
tara:strand:+ start:487 stop:1419 length:933 start_codon:yes stop_codon:yes gene_type:complete